MMSEYWRLVIFPSENLDTTYILILSNNYYYIAQTILLQLQEKQKYPNTFRNFDYFLDVQVQLFSAKYLFKYIQYVIEAQDYHKRKIILDCEKAFLFKWEKTRHFLVCSNPFQGGRTAILKQIQDENTSNQKP